MTGLDWNSLTPSEQQALLDGPSLQPPTGTLPNFDSPPNGNGIAYATIGLCLGLSTIFLSLRAYATFTYLKKPYISDYVMTVAYVFYAAYLILLITECRYQGYLVHEWNIRLRDLPHILYNYLIGTCLFLVAIALVKAAILLEWLRIFVPKGSRGNIFWISRTLLCINILINVAGLFVINLACIPHEKIWNRLTVPGHCIENHAFDIISAAINLSIDLLILLLPQRVIWSLKISTTKRIGVAAVFTVGILGCIAAIFRLISAIQYASSPDITYTFSALGLWAVAESTCGILVFSVPTVPKAFASLAKLSTITSARSWSSRSRSDGQPFPPRSIGKKRLKPRIYEELDDSQLVTMDTLAPATCLSRPCASIHEHSQEEDTQAAILRTTQISTTSEHVDETENARGYLNRQHPWELHPYQHTTP
ncbi:hypothetical protein F5Y01DRAFT_205411 [Xylaria sp. FL0043]|nr:hypothetical protein F5Y01DRAFT_205411 [Xylaria sp. FL0043]